MNPNVTVIQPKTTEDKNCKIRVDAYCRVSSDSADQLNSYMAQMRYYESFLSGSDTKILVNVYADEGITGTSMDKREDFQRMLKDCRRGKIDRIISKSVSRFARNTKECLTVIRELKSLGITVMFEKENIDTANISDEMMITIMGGLAQEESISISNNIKWSYHNQMKAGTIKLHSAPYGYTLYNGQLIINQAEAKIIREIFDMFLSGCGYMAICHELNSRNIPKDDKKTKWLPAAIRYILTNEKYIGDSLWQKSYNTAMPFRKVRNHGEQEMFYLPATHEPIILKDKYELVQKLISIKRKSNKNKIQDYPLSRKIICGDCGSVFRRKTHNAKTYWTCRKHTESAELCSIKQIPEVRLYEAFIIMYNKLKSQYDIIFTPLLSQLQELKTKKFSSNQQYMEISKNIAQLKEQIHVLTRLKTKEFLDDEKYFSQTAELNSKIEKQNQELRKIARSDDEDEIIDQVKELASIIENSSDFMTEFDEVMFASLVEKIIVKNQTTLEFHLYGGLKLTEKSVKDIVI